MCVCVCVCVCVRFCVLGELFTVGLPTGTIVSVGSLGRTSMILEDLKLVRTPRTSLTRGSCALFKCVITILNLIYAVTPGNSPDDDRRKYR